MVSQFCGAMVIDRLKKNMIFISKKVQDASLCFAKLLFQCGKERPTFSPGSDLFSIKHKND